jgi:phospholipase/carboxylesterase
MATRLALSGPSFDPQSGGKPTSLVVLLHGWGANGDDLVGLAPYLAPALPDALFLSPNAPFPCDANPMGLQWFSFEDRGEAALLGGLRLAGALVDAFLDEQLAELGLAADRLALVGFSQGTMLALHVAPRRARQIAGVVGYSGALMSPALLAEELVTKPPLLLVHGQSDPVVPVQATLAAAEAFKALGVPVETLLRPGLPHSIDEAGLQAAQAFLRRALAPR